MDGNAPPPDLLAALARMGLAVPNGVRGEQLTGGVSSDIWRIAEKPFAMASPWPRCEEVIRSVTRRMELAPTAVPSWPIETCVGPR